MLLELFLGACVFFLLAVLRDRKPAGMPPGPPEVPFLGQSPAITAKEAKELRDKYGSLVTQRLGNTRTVLVFDYSDVKDLFSRQEFSSRPEFFKTFNLDETDCVGVLFNNGPLWSHGRRFILRQLRALGTSSSRLEEAVRVEARALVQHIAAFGGRPVTDPPGFETAVLNVIWQLTTGRRYPLNAEEVCSIFKLVEGVKQVSGSSVVLRLFPVLSWLPTAVKDKLFEQQRLKEFLDTMRRLVEKSVTERKGTLEYDSALDFINDYLKEMDQQVLQGDLKYRLRIQDLHQLLYDLFNTGSDTVANMLRWVAYYMAKYPHIAARCQQEIDAVVPFGEPVTLEQKQRLPFVEAFTSEALRHASMVVFIPQRCSDKEVSIRGYTLPKGTVITTCNLLTHRDPRHWADPDLFCPERFLDSSGCYRPQRDGFLPFGIGRRQCVGEALARTEYFLFSAALLQSFHIRPPDGAELQEEPHEWLGIRTPAQQPFVFTLRHPMENNNMTS